MTLKQFLMMTAEMSDVDLRPALALALKPEIPRSRDGYARYYERVIARLVKSGALARAA